MSEIPRFERKTSESEIADVLNRIVEENPDEEKILVTVNSLSTHFKLKKNKSITDQTLRRYGVNPDGIFVKKYPEVFQYKTDSRTKRGLVIDVEKFEETDIEFMDGGE